MATVTVFTAERTAEIEATSIVQGEINSAGHLILTRHDGVTIDTGAVSGMQMNPGTGYEKVDAFSYIGPTDPGSVPNGSVWYDTTDVAGPTSSVTQKGLVELATNAETLTGTDTTRAVTPAGLASLPGSRVQVLSGISETQTPTAWPTGISMQSVTTGSGWTPALGVGTIVTNKVLTDRTQQTFYSVEGGTGSPRMWVRFYHTTNNGGGWTAWQQTMLMNNLVAASFTQATAFTSYPLGQSRLYYTAATSTGWDFSGKAGEVVTFRDGTDFARQQWTKHQGGTSGETAVWVRTANTASGWSPWRILGRDAKLPDPIATKNPGTQAVTATSWADHPANTTLNLTIPYDAIVQVEFAAWLSVSYVDTTSVRAGVSLNGNNPEDLFGGTWGNVVYIGTQGSTAAGGQHGFSATGKLSAGTYPFKVMAYKTGTGNALVNYHVLRVTVLRWAD